MSKPLAHLLAPQHQHSALRSGLEAIFGASLTGGGQLGLSETVPSHASVAALCPLRSGRMSTDLEEGPVGAASVFTRASSAFVWDGQHQAFNEIYPGIAKFHGCRTVTNELESVDEWSVGANVTDFETVGDGARWTVVGAGDTNNVRMADWAQGGTERSTAGRLYSWRLDLKAADEASVGALVRITCKRRTGGTSDGDVARAFALSREFVTLCGISRGDVIPNAASVGIALRVREDDTFLGNFKVHVRRAAIVDITHQIPYWMERTGATIWTDLRDHFIPPPEWTPYGVDSTDTGNPIHFWRARDYDQFKYHQVAPTRALASGETSMWVIDYEPGLGEPLHPVSGFGAGYLRFCLYPTVARSTAYAVGDRVVPDGLRPYSDGAGTIYANEGVWFECRVAGTTHASATLNGSWNADLGQVHQGPQRGAEIVDGTVTWALGGRYARGGPGYHCEGARTNVGPVDSRTLSDVGSYSLNGTPVISNAPGVDGQVRDLSVEDDDATASEGVLWSITVPADTTTYAISVFVKKWDTGGAETLIQSTFNAAAQTLVFDPRDGSETLGAGAGTHFLEDWGRWWRVVFNLANDSHTMNIMVMLPTWGTSGVEDVTLIGTCVFDFPQIEAGEHAGSPIWNDGAETTRIRDSLLVTDGLLDLDKAENFWLATLAMLTEGETASGRIIADENNSVIRTNTGSSQQRITTVDGTTTLHIGTLGDLTWETLEGGIHPSRRCAMSASAVAGTFLGALHGVGASDTFDGLIPASPSEALGIGQDADLTDGTGSALSCILMFPRAARTHTEAAMEAVTDVDD